MVQKSVRIGLFLKYDREVVKWSKIGSFPIYGGELTGMELSGTKFNSKFGKEVGQWALKHYNLILVENALKNILQQLIKFHQNSNIHSLLSTC